MPAPATADEFLDLIRKSGVVDDARLSNYVRQLQSSSNIPTDLSKLAGLFVRDGLLTFFQAENFLQGKWKRFTIGKYKVLERIGSGGMGQVFLCEHKLMRRKVAVKVLPTAKAEDQSSLDRFYREARAVAALDHPNIVRAYDIDQDDNLHFLVMEYVDGASLQDIIKKHGPMDVLRACHYMYWSAIGLEHAHDAGLIHRDIKPGNILIDRQGTVKILDMGLARFFNDDEDMLTKKYDENVLGTADYLAPEQALDSHSVDGRADIYSLGATFYFLLSGAQPFVDGTVAQKLIWHQTRKPESLRNVRPEVPDGVVAIIEKMMAKNTQERFQSPKELAEALAPWVQTPIEAPPEHEMPQLSKAAQAVGSAASSTTTRQVAPQVPKSDDGSGTRQTTAGSGVPKPKSAGNGSSKRDSKESMPVRKLPAPTPVSDTEDTTRRANPAPIIESLPPDLEPVWESLATDTNNVSRDNTERQPNPAKSKPKLKPAKNQQEERSAPNAQKSSAARKLTKKSSITTIAIIALSIVAVGSCFAVWWFVIRTPSKNDTVNGDSSRLTVSKAGGGGQFQTIQDALGKAVEGSRIVILDSPWEEAVRVVTGQGNGVTIEGAEGKEIVWKLPSSSRAEYVLQMLSPERMRIRNLSFDGERQGGQITAAISVTEKVSGLLLEDLAIRNSKIGILFVNCIAAEPSPAIVQRVRILSNGKSPNATGENAISFLGSRNESIYVDNCVMAGPFTGAAIQIEGNLNRIELRKNRIWNANDGLFFKDIKPNNVYRIKVVSNTIHTIKNAALHFKNAAVLAPILAQQSLEIEQNYFCANGIVLRSDDGFAFDGRSMHFMDNARNQQTPEGNPTSNSISVDSQLATNPDEDKQFLRYDRNSPLAKVGPLQKPVGVPPGS